MNCFTRRALAILFFVSGFSSLVYQIVWTRLAFASFGIIAPVLSIVLSVFMLGLALGSWAGGRMIVPTSRQTGRSAIYFYAAAEMLIGVGAFIVPMLFKTSERLLAGVGQLNSFSYLFYSALALGIAIFPWCVLMGTTFPFMMAFVKEKDAKRSDSFSFLYVANVLGAMLGTALTAIVLVEVLGFHHTLWVAAGGNFLIALTSSWLGVAEGASPQPREGDPSEDSGAATRTLVTSDRLADPLSKSLLFSTGFLSMAMEVVWSRGFVPVLKTQVYSFALILFAYLLATAAGSLLYRAAVRRGRFFSYGNIFFWMAVAALLPVFLLDPTVTVQLYTYGAIDPPSAILILASILPLCALLGYLTPRLIDQYSSGRPGRAGAAYAANVVGCILGPLCACYLLLPHISTRYSLILLGCPFIAFWLIVSKPKQYQYKMMGGLLLAAVIVRSLLYTADFDEVILKQPHGAVDRDYIASVATFGDDRLTKTLLVNGMGMTVLSPITKIISHLPLALHRDPPHSVLVVCFGMGTSYRSALTWDVDVTAVELVPSVPKRFGFFHADAKEYVDNPRGHIVIDDGRRYLSRCGRKFDVIVVDPPPPIEAAGSSLLFSTGFYALAKQHLNPGGIVQIWYPGGGDKTTDQAVVRSMYDSFPFVRGFVSIEGWGMHLLGSMEPIEVPPIDRVVARLPPAAKVDLVEWTPGVDATGLMTSVLRRQLRVEQMLSPDPSIEITDDRPMNEYYLLRDLKKNPD
ncbi:MAG TPA: hypothetical protein VLI90_18390 [Tepidisphaeraceae bacterium]|nr:hypothetical protein [Tepidisphaeraceae bacterium]